MNEIPDHLRKEIQLALDEFRGLVVMAEETLESARALLERRRKRLAAFESLLPTFEETLAEVSTWGPLKLQIVAEAAKNLRGHHDLGLAICDALRLRDDGATFHSLWEEIRSRQKEAR